MGEFIGMELSIPSKLVEALAKEKPGHRCELLISVTKLGDHEHMIGKGDKRMTDVKINSVKYEEENENGKE
jgi:hypothetical protein